MKSKNFRIREVARNINGKPYKHFVVSGTIDGQRVQKSFVNRAEAEGERARQEVLRQNSPQALRIISRMSEPQAADAESALSLLGDGNGSLSSAVAFYRANYRAPERDVSLTDAADEYISAKRKECKRGLISELQVRAINWELATFQKWFPAHTLAQFSATVLVPYLERNSPSLKTYNNRRGVLLTFFKFAFQKDWIVINPVEKTPHHRINHRRGSAVTITAEQAGKLMAYVETFKGGALVPYFALCLFAGIRPNVLYGEIKKLRPESVRLDTGIIFIEPEVSKVKMKRNITIQPNVAMWLRAYPLEKFPIICSKNMTRMRTKIFEAFGLTYDVLRHTFISMLVGRDRSVGDAALQAGNSESIIAKHYLDLKSKAEAEQFWGILAQWRLH